MSELTEILLLTMLAGLAMPVRAALSFAPTFAVTG